jgi:diguanylate cyclase (GGDEF)-like protein
MSEQKHGLGPQGLNIDFSPKLPENIPEGKTGLPIIDANNKIEKLIYRDTLTDFENRRGLKRYKDNLTTDQYPLTIITFDLDNLKKINDNPDPEKGGHTGGDKYILSFVKFVNEVFPDIQKFRLGGDEFGTEIPKEKINEYQEKIKTLDQLLKDFNEREQNPNELEFTYASDIATSDKDFYPGLKRSDDKLVEAKKIKKAQPISI